MIFVSRQGIICRISYGTCLGGTEMLSKCVSPWGTRHAQTQGDGASIVSPMYCTGVGSGLPWRVTDVTPYSLRYCEIQVCISAQLKGTKLITHLSMSMSFKLVVVLQHNVSD